MSKNLDFDSVLVDHWKNRNAKNLPKRRLHVPYIYRNELDKTYFPHDMTCEDFKDLPTKIAFNNVLLNKTLKSASYQRWISMWINTYSL